MIVSIYLFLDIMEHYGMFEKDVFASGSILDASRVAFR